MHSYWSNNKNQYSSIILDVIITLNIYIWWYVLIYLKFNDWPKSIFNEVCQVISKHLTRQFLKTTICMNEENGSRRFISITHTHTHFLSLVRIEITTLSDCIRDFVPNSYCRHIHLLRNFQEEPILYNNILKRWKIFYKICILFIHTMT